jgi:3D (Asp-Asp-Asp) domain-containing protein
LKDVVGTMLLLSRSLRRKILATALTAGAFVLLYEASINDARRPTAPVEVLASAPTPAAGSRLEFTATAYCKGSVTAAGVAPQAGIAAADPLLLPEGSVVQVDDVPHRYQGIYTVMDTGPKVQGRHVDLYMWSCIEAMSFGRRPIRLTVLRLGWHPRNTAADAVRAHLGNEF